jgi:hypothetical protein
MRLTPRIRPLHRGLIRVYVKTCSTTCYILTDWAGICVHHGHRIDGCVLVRSYNCCSRLDEINMMKTRA